MCITVNGGIFRFPGCNNNITHKNRRKLKACGKRRNKEDSYFNFKFYLPITNKVRRKLRIHSKRTNKRDFNYYYLLTVWDCFTD